MKSLIVKADKKRCIVLKGDGTFLEIRNRGFSVGQEIELHSKPAFPKVCAAAAVLVACFSAASMTALSRMPFSYIYLDINPSMRIELNGFNDVLSVVPLNSDAEALIASHPISSDSIETCIEDIVYHCQQESYLSENNKGIEISVLTQQDEVEHSILTTSNHLKQGDFEVDVYTVNNAENRLAVKQNASGKLLRAVKEYTAYFGGTLSENMTMLHGQTAEEILETIRAARRSTHGKDLDVHETAPLTGKKQSSDDSHRSKQQIFTEKKNERRLTAVQRYTEYFGGSVEENIQKTENLSIPEIYAEIREHRQSKPFRKSPVSEPIP